MRKEKDSMGEMQVPDDALYGASTQRAVLNFPISGSGLPCSFIKVLGAIKVAAVEANLSLRLIDNQIGDAIRKSATEIWEGKFFEQFVVDVFQTGSGTSTNMNANEVIANRANTFLSAGATKVHPNDHVNMCQSSNDVIPSAISVASVIRVKSALIPALEEIERVLLEKAHQFSEVIKSGRTHLQDATPVTLGQEFGGFAFQVSLAKKRIEAAVEELCSLTLGGTAVGTGINTHPAFADVAIENLSRITGVQFRRTENHFALQGGQEGAVALSGALRTLACALMKIGNDIRWMSSGPRCGFGELKLPAVQPGSSIMPAKVNPVIAESLLMVCAQVMGNDACIMVAGQHGNFELNVMLPVIARNLLESIELLSAATKNFTHKCLLGLEADLKQCLEYAQNSLSICTSLVPHIGYDRSAQVSKLATQENLSVREAALKMGVLSAEELDKVLDLYAMIRPGL